MNTKYNYNKSICAYRKLGAIRIEDSGIYCVCLTVSIIFLFAGKNISGSQGLGLSCGVV